MSSGRINKHCNRRRLRRGNHRRRMGHDKEEERSWETQQVSVFPFQPPHSPPPSVPNRADTINTPPASSSHRSHGDRSTHLWQPTQPWKTPRPSNQTFWWAGWYLAAGHIILQARVFDMAYTAALDQFLGPCLGAAPLRQVTSRASSPNAYVALTSDL